MSSLTTMFEKLFNFQYSVCLRKHFLLPLQHRKIAKAKSEVFLTVLNDCQKISQFFARRAIAFCNLKIAAILLANTIKSLKFHRFESI